MDPILQTSTGWGRFFVTLSTLFDMNPLIQTVLLYALHLSTPTPIGLLLSATRLG